MTELTITVAGLRVMARDQVRSTVWLAGQRRVRGHKITRDTMISRYAMLIVIAGLAPEDPDLVSWAQVNQAIMDRWSEAGLVYIKRRGWDMATQDRELLESSLVEAALEAARDQPQGGVN